MVVNKKEVIMNRGNVKIIFSGIKRNKIKINYAYYEKCGYDRKGFLNDKEFMLLAENKFNIFNGDVWFNCFFQSKRADKIREAWLKVEDELRRRGWINIDKKLKEMKK